MKLLREMIQLIILEDKESFLADLLDQPDWDEGTLDTFKGKNRKPERLYPRARKRGRLVKQVWADHVDREYIDSLVYIHWGSASSTYEKIAMSEKGSGKKNEIACSGYERGKVAEQGSIGRFGCVIEGHVSLFANDMNKVYSGRLQAIQKFNPEMKDTSGFNRGAQGAFADTYILDRESFIDRDNPEKNQTEAFLDNWTVKALVFQPVPDNMLMAQEEEELAERIQDNFPKLPILTPKDL